MTYLLPRPSRQRALQAEQRARELVAEGCVALLHRVVAVGVEEAGEERGPVVVGVRAGRGGGGGCGGVLVTAVVHCYLLGVLIYFNGFIFLGGGLCVCVCVCVCVYEGFWRYVERGREDLGGADILRRAQWEKTGVLVFW